MLKVLVTGGAGFIGSHIVNHHVSLGDKVWVIDNLTTGRASNLPDDIEMLYTNWERIPDVDFVYHLGMPSSSPIYKENPKLVARTVMDAIRLLEYAKMNKVPVVFASTSSLYNGNLTPWDEYQQIQVTDYYAEARFAVERLFELYNKLHGVKSIGLRLFSVYGPGEKPKGQYANLVTQFLLDMKQGKRPLIFFDGNQTRDFIHVNDVQDAFYKSMILLMSDKVSFLKINVGTGIANSLNCLVELINKELGTNIKPTYFTPKITNYIWETLADTVVMNEMLKIKPISLEMGLHNLALYYGGE